MTDLSSAAKKRKIYAVTTVIQKITFRGWEIVVMHRHLFKIFLIFSK